MELTPFRIERLTPPKDDLFARIKASTSSLEEYDVIAISSKVVSIGEGRCVLKEGVDVDELIKSEADKYLERAHTPGGFVLHTITNGTLIPNAGIDPLGDYYVLWPENPKQCAEDLLAWFKKEYAIENLYLVLTDSRSVFLRRGVVGMAIGWAGFDPVYDNRDRTDILGATSRGSQTNLPDALAAAAVLVMGEANEQTPIVRIRNAPYVKEARMSEREHGSYEFAVEEDIFAPFMQNLSWKTGGRPQQGTH